jgi:hypothetical protein
VCFLCVFSSSLFLLCDCWRPPRFITFSLSLASVRNRSRIFFSISPAHAFCVVLMSESSLPLRLLFKQKISVACKSNPHLKAAHAKSMSWGLNGKRLLSFQCSKDNIYIQFALSVGRLGKYFLFLGNMLARDGLTNLLNTAPEILFAKSILKSSCSSSNQNPSENVSMQRARLTSKAGCIPHTLLTITCFRSSNLC